MNTTQRERQCKRSNRTGSVSKSIKANYLNGQAGLFKLVSSTRLIRLKEKPDVSTNPGLLLLHEFERD